MDSAFPLVVVRYDLITIISEHALKTTTTCVTLGNQQVTKSTRIIDYSKWLELVHNTKNAMFQMKRGIMIGGSNEGQGTFC